jgi:hypothetical protein
MMEEKVNAETVMGKKGTENIFQPFSLRRVPNDVCTEALHLAFSTQFDAIVCCLHAMVSSLRMRGFNHCHSVVKWLRPGFSTIINRLSTN